VSIWPSPQGLALDMWAWAKKAHTEKPPSKKPIGPKTLQNPCGSGPTHGLSSSP